MSTVMSGFGRIVSYAFNSLDMSSAANDVIVVQHLDGSLHSSPFHVRFGKVKVLRPQDKVVSVEVNGVVTKAVMKIGPDGEAFWLEPTDNTGKDRPESPVDARMLASPILTQRSEGSSNPPPVMSLEAHAPKSPPATQKSPPNSPSKKLLSPESAATAHSAPPVSTADTAMAVELYVSNSDSSSDARPAAHIDVNDIIMVDPCAGTITRPKLRHSHSMELRDDVAAIDVINCAGDEELEEALGVVDAEEYFAQDMSSREREKYDELLRSITTGRQGSEQLPHDGLALSKLASCDDVVTQVSGQVDTPPVAPAIATVCVPQFAGGSQAQSAAGQSTTSSNADEELEEDEEGEGDEDDDGDDSEGEGTVAANVAPVLYYRQTLTPISADLEKLRLKAGQNKVRYITHTSLRGRVVVEANIYLWPSDTKIVVSDIDGTVTKSDVWGHILPMIGRDWTHAGICSLYTKVAKNGYQFVYLTARSISQQEQTRQFLWGIEQEGLTLPRGPVMTAPDRFFTALTQEVSKRSHEFKIMCLKGISKAFPKASKPFYAGFGNRIGDVISYTATQIPKHKIFIIDTTSTLHVCRVKQTYKNLAHLVDVTFPPMEPSAIVERTDDNAEALARTQNSSSPSSGSSSPSLSAIPSSGAVAVKVPPMNPSKKNDGMLEGESVDAEFNSFNFWRIPPEELVAQHPNNVVKPQAVATPAPSEHPSLVHTLPKSNQSNPSHSKPPAADGKGWLSRWLSKDGHPVEAPARK